MGERADVVMKQGDKQVVFYVHWDGYKLGTLVQNAIVRGVERWNDESYFARVVFCELIKGKERGLTGYGISTETCGDNNYDCIVVDCDTLTVKVMDNDLLETYKFFTFKEFAELPEDVVKEINHFDKRTI